MVVQGKSTTAARAAVAAAMLAAAPAAHAQGDNAAGWPKQPIKIIVGFAPGGGNDVVSRIIGHKLGERLGVPVLIENRAGASGFIAADLVARASPDGYTLFSATMGTMVISPAVYAKLPYDPLKSFAHIGIVGSSSLALVVDASRGIGTIGDLVAYTKANPDKSNYGSASPLFQLPTELFKAKTGARVEHIPFKGSQETAGMNDIRRRSGTDAQDRPGTGSNEGIGCREQALNRFVKLHRLYEDFEQHRGGHTRERRVHVVGPAHDILGSQADEIGGFGGEAE